MKKTLSFTAGSRTILFPLVMSLLISCGSAEDSSASDRGSIRDRVEEERDASGEERKEAETVSVTQAEAAPAEEAVQTEAAPAEVTGEAAPAEAPAETAPEETPALPDSRLADRPNANAGTGTIRELSEGDVAPDFTVDTYGGGTFTLSDHDDEVVIVNFWATWCPPCVGELPAFERLAQDGNAVVIGIDCAESRSDVDRFIAQKGYTYTIGYDDDYTVEAYYPTDGIPYTLVIDRGIIHSIFLGADSADRMYQEYSAAIAECLE